MPRGGKRQGTPGKGYSNRTDLMSAPDMGQNTAATGGMAAKPSRTPAPMLSRTPDDSPMLTQPSQRPWEPITSGSDFGPGVRGDALGIKSYEQMNQEDMVMVREMMPRLLAASQMNNAPDTFKKFVAYLRRTV